jgi:hypothetical protein
MQLNGQLHSLAAVPPVTSTRYSLNRRLDGPQKRSGRFGDQEKPSDSVRIETKILGFFSPWPSRYTDYALSASKEILSKK